MACEHRFNTFSTYELERIRFSSKQNIGEGESKFDDKYVEKVFNKCSTGQSFIFPK